MLSLNIFLCQRGKSYLYDALKTLGFKISLIIFNSICTACSYSTGKTSGWSQCSNCSYVSYYSQRFLNSYDNHSNETILFIN